MSAEAPPLRIGREDARRAAAEELSKSRYEDESFLEQLWREGRELLAAVLDRLGSGGVESVLSLVVLVVLLAALALLLLWSLRRIFRRAARPAEGDLFGTEERTAAEHRAAAQGLAEQERWGEAIQERLRAITRDVEERDILVRLPGRTAHEVAAAAGEELPAYAERLAEAARLFDAVTYGDHPGSADGYASLARLDEALRTATPTPTRAAAKA